MNRTTTAPRLLAISLPVCLLLWSALAVGQIGTRDLSGSVTDHGHEPLKGAVVQLQNGVTMGVVSYITGRDGKYSFKRLDGETDYILWVNFRGQKSKIRKLSQFDSDRPRTIDFTLDLH